MTSLSPSHQSPSADSNHPTEQTILLPATSNLSSPIPNNLSEIGQNQSEDDQKQDQPWKPRPDRRQSWSVQDYKHELQDQMVRAQQQGEQTGFTESENM
ncbi:hypothetical protein N7510_003470 [Penicillium lagena]|uniref:uncharacterized protein n=1 Tax=Penicillium lagena TaxID=94218 RepID=UPI00253F96BF|nr:uncharacterized protein N7510_003470 [Penicillium lagena]KAJ5619486.1 hypothetical protein N7510_003470 [Penicillium lagena]